VAFQQKRLIFNLFLVISAILALLVQAITAGAETTGKKAVWIPAEHGVERGLENFLRRAFQEAEAQGAQLVILEVDTPGGEMEAAGSIGELVRQASMQVVAYIDNQAFSAGTYIALNADQIIMTPGASIGAATPIDVRGNAADLKVISAWSEKMAAAANMNGRDPEIARAMVEIDMELKGIKPRGKVLSLDAQQAQKLGYADKVVADRNALLRELGMNPEDVTRVEPTIAERIARAVTSPVVMSLLLVIGLVGVTIELFHPGFGVAGSIGLSSFALYFFGHYIAGFANWLHIGLFVLGIVLLILEIFIPGGVVGSVGFVSMVSGLVLAAYDTQQGLAALGIAVLATIVVTFVLFKYFGFRGMWEKLILRDTQQNEAGYVAPRDRRALQDKTGISLTPLRPAGVVKIDGERVDAVTEGGFIPAGRPIKVVYVEGTRVVVMEQENPE